MLGPRLVRRVVPVAVDLSKDFDHIVGRVLAARGIQTAASLDTALTGLARPEQLSGMAIAVELLAEACVAQRRICIVGDYDADGATSCALALRALAMLGAGPVDFVVPNRFEYGYGLTPPIVELVCAKGAQVLITVDNGMSSIEGVAAAKAAGLCVIVTDHHLPGATLPAADAIVNPNAQGDAFPSKALAGVGVIFYVMLALRARLRQDGWFAARGIPDPNLANCWTWSRSGRWPTSCLWMLTIVVWWRRGWRVCARVAACRASPRSSALPAKIPAVWWPQIWALRSARA